MKVLKFGGTSLGTPQRMKQVVRLIQNDRSDKIVVLSAVSGTTNALVEMNKLLEVGNTLAFSEALAALRTHYRAYLEALFDTQTAKEKAQHFLNQRFAQLENRAETAYSEQIGKENLAQGEIISTHLMRFYLHECGQKVVLLDACSFMTTVNGEPDLAQIASALKPLLDNFPEQQLFLTQGYICLNQNREIDNLKRGGSDYTASLIGAALKAEEIQIWTDIDGMHNNDPRIVDETFPVRELSFDEAAELAYFGAKILHPSSVLPAQSANVPVRLLNTMKPEAKGTRITSKTTARKIKAIAAKDNIVAIKIKSSRMLMAYGFLRKVFEVFEQFRTPIDMITTSEVAISLTIDEEDNLNAIAAALRHFGQVEIDKNQSIICVVGQFLQSNTAIVVSVLKALQEIPIRMISYGGSKSNVSLLVNQSDKKRALQLLNTHLFEL